MGLISARAALMAISRPAWRLRELECRSNLKFAAQVTESESYSIPDAEFKKFTANPAHATFCRGL